MRAAPYRAAAGIGAARAARRAERQTPTTAQAVHCG
jgi:hypothetical protein